jgi:hypothetical protein
MHFSQMVDVANQVDMDSFVGWHGIALGPYDMCCRTGVLISADPGPVHHSLA